MRLLASIILMLVGTAMSNGSLLDVPFSQLTMRMVLGNLVAGACFVGGIYFAFESCEKDAFWPWRRKKE